MQTIEQNFYNSLNHEVSNLNFKNFNPKPKAPPCNKNVNRQSISVIKPKMIFPALLRELDRDEKNLQRLEKLKWQPTEIQYTELQIQILFNEVTLEQWHATAYVFHFVEF